MRSEYVGGGQAAQICAETDADERKQQAVRSANECRTRQAEAEIDGQINEVAKAISTIASSALLAAGYHKHKGQWRKRRYGKRKSRIQR